MTAPVLPLHPEPRTWTLVHEARPMTMNAYRRLHGAQANKHTQEWREVFGWLAREARVPHLDRVVITVAQTCTKTLPDPGASYPTVKAAIDGLVDAHVIPDDTGRHVPILQFVAPEKGDKDRLILTITEHLDDEEQVA